MERDFPSPDLEGFSPRVAFRQRLLSNVNLLTEIRKTGDSERFGEIFREYNKLIELSLTRNLSGEELIRTRHLEAQIQGDLGPTGITQIFDHWQTEQIRRQSPNSPFKE